MLCHSSNNRNSLFHTKLSVKRLILTHVHVKYVYKIKATRHDTRIYKPTYMYYWERGGSKIIGSIEVSEEDNEQYREC